MTGQTVATATSGGRDAPLAGQLEHQVAAHRVANQCHALQAEPLGEVAHHASYVGRAAGVIERRCERIAAAAVAHVHAHGVHAGCKGARGDPLNVSRIRGTLEAMHQHHREPLGAHRRRLPMAVTENAAAIGRIDLDRLSDSGQAKRATGKKVADDGLQVAVCQPGMRLKGGEPRWKFSKVLD